MNYRWLLLPIDKLTERLILKDILESLNKNGKAQAQLDALLKEV